MLVQSDEVAISRDWKFVINLIMLLVATILLQAHKKIEHQMLKFKINKVKYISNIVLTDEDGTTFKYPKTQEVILLLMKQLQQVYLLNLKNVPAGNYKNKIWNRRRSTAI
jgi:hypothetical protein